MATYPWTVGRPLGWGETVSFDDDVPTFPGCRSVFLAGPWEYGQAGSIDTTTEPVRVINVVPISDAERTRALSARPEAFFSELLDARGVFAPPAAKG
ncbi:suppressor of fused domain protein [Streptomyces lunaelactis]|uniref:suppressor of fused domain protein n=1 Tax=Streptomyces lunaelactis TaxID=1535768 RepID=UPI001584740A|nr:suppressor of fused domain protein [Streptomyces lunaelactis]NUK03974.1 suppressor of fused domain protein [Streptomyces lunaelactis]NUK18479.1 suppressor of fused domain protein [Streptomyces lunaelactis]NUK55264.1 suppressor of fused domain protein [Streptomyces lunaelactis]NUK68972.1 suppressor of fused domain protein [Streptomyces lunaelactis]